MTTELLIIIGRCVQCAFLTALYFLTLNVMLQKKETLEAQETYYTELAYKLEEDEM